MRGDNIIKINKSAARTIEVLNLLAKAENPMTLTDISHQINMPMSSTFELLYTLVQKDVVEIDNKVTKTFKLGIKIFEIGVSVAKKMDLHNVARPIMEKLSSETSETVFLAVADHGYVIYLDRVEANSSITTNVGLGASCPMHTTGIGKALLASFPNEKVSQITGTGKLQTRTPFSIGHYDELIVELNRIRKRGFSIDDRENEIEIFCVAAPIYDRVGAPIAAVSIASIFSRMNDERVNHLGRLITKAALEISRKLGFLGDKLYFNV